MRGVGRVLGSSLGVGFRRLGIALGMGLGAACIAAEQRGASADTVADVAPEPEPEPETETETETGPETEPETETETDTAPETAAACQGLFGTPNARTGLTTEQCKPVCACAGAAPWSPPAYDAAFLADLATWELATPYAVPPADPYADGAIVVVADAPEAVCAVVPEHNRNGPRRYRLETFATESAAREAGATPTHTGHCGVCSPLADLAVYIAQPDLTEPVRACGLQGMRRGKDANVACLRALGFDAPCAEVWYYNTLHTRSVCLEPCLAALDAPYHTPDGALNPCLACDETQSGPVFKMVAGRTRRNSGLANAMCRPCDEVRPLVHHYE